MKRDSSNPKILVATILSMSLLTVMAGAAVAPALNAISAHFADANPLLIQFVVSMPRCSSSSPTSVSRCYVA